MPEVRRRSRVRRGIPHPARSSYLTCARVVRTCETKLPTQLDVSSWYLLRAVLLRTTIHTSPFGCNLLQSTDRPQNRSHAGALDLQATNNLSPYLPTCCTTYLTLSLPFPSGPNGGCGGRFASCSPLVQSPTRPVQSLHLQPRRQEALPPTPRQRRGAPSARHQTRGARRLSPPQTQEARHPMPVRRSHQRRGWRHPRQRSAWRPAAQTPRWRWGWRSRRSWWRRPTCRRLEWRTTPHRSPRQTRAQT